MTDNLFAAFRRTFPGYTPQRRSSQGAISTWIRRFASSQTPTGVGTSARADPAAGNATRRAQPMRSICIPSRVSRGSLGICSALQVICQPREALLPHRRAGTAALPSM